MTLTHKIYSELHNSVKNTDEEMLSKPYTNLKDLPLIYAVAKSDEKEKLYFSIGQDDVDSVPKFKGLEVSRVRLYEYSKLDYYCELSPRNVADGEMFEVIIEDIRKNTDEVSTNNQMFNRVSNVLLKWRNFFAQEKNLLLSPERQQGLYGELMLLRSLIEWKGIGAVNYWTGADYETHDYYINNNAIEVKTTSTKSPYKMHISSEHQLDSDDVSGNLYVAFYALRKSTADGETLPEIINSIRNLLKENRLWVNEFDLNLQKYGYFDGLEKNYFTGYHLREMNYYIVKDKFPRIEKKQLPEGISNCLYHVAIDNCKGYIVEAKDIERMVKGGGQNV
jgi:hypothetical protein